MSMKEHILAALREEFDRWEELLAGFSEDQLTATNLPSNLSVKDVIAHLWAWQQRSISRLQAGQSDLEPEFPKWPAELGSDPDVDADLTNAWIRQTYHEWPWSRVHQEWRDGFLRFLQLGAAIPEQDLLDGDKYPWMEGYPLSFVLESSYFHHHFDHFEPLLAWFKRKGA